MTFEDNRPTRSEIRFVVTLAAVDSLSFDLIKLGYHLALAVIVGGSLALGSAAPAVFGAVRSRAEAGSAFGALVARFDQLAVVAVVVLIATTLARAIGYETADARHAIRWAAIVLLVALTLYSSAWAHPVARSIRAQAAGFDEMPDSSPLRREFAVLHRRSRRAMTLAIVLGTLILFLS